MFRYAEEIFSVGRELQDAIQEKPLGRPLKLEVGIPALMNVFGQDGIGLFPAPTVIEKELCRQYKVRIVGRIDSVRERYYAISVECRLKHPAVLAI